MSAAAVRSATDLAQETWDSRVRALTARWAALLADAPRSTDAYAELRRMLVRETRLAADLGSETARTILYSTGLDPAPRPTVDTDAPLDLFRTVETAWRVAELQPDPRRSRIAAVTRIVDLALTNAWRDGAHAVYQAEPDVIGWRRVSRAGCCGACLALANGRVMPFTERLDEHPFGRCFQEPAIRGVNDIDWGRPTPQQRWDAMSAEQQDEMFAGHGGAAKADLIRRGDATLDDLVAWQPRDPDQPNHRQLPRESTLRELKLDDDERAALSHRTGIEFGADAVTPSSPSAPQLGELLPAADRAVVPAPKLRDYALNPDHPVGGPKARLWRSVLGFERDDWQLLRDRLLEAVADTPVTDLRAGERITTFETILTITGTNGRRAEVVAAWQIVDGAPRLVTAFPRV